MVTHIQRSVMNRRNQKIVVGMVLIIVGLWVAKGTAWAGPYPLWRVSLSSQQVEANGASSEPKIATSGREVVFTSDATSLVTGDTNDRSDVFRHDLSTRTTERVSVATDGSQGNGSSGHPAISFDGMVIAFNSAATNLVPSDTNAFADVFVRDLRANTTIRLSVAHNGGESNASSRFPVMGGDGFQVAYESDATNLVEVDNNSVTDVFLWDNETFLISKGLNDTPANGSSHAPAVSAYAKEIVFESVATNLVEGDTNAHLDIFLVDRDTGILERVSVSSEESQANGPSTEAAISDDGRFVVFASFANNLVPNDTNGRSDIFLRNRQLGTTTRIIAGIEPNGTSMTPVVASVGEVALVLFASEATNLVAEDNNQKIDIFAYQTNVGVMRRLSETGQELPANGHSSEPAITPDFLTILFTSEADNLVSDDLNGVGDIFVEAPVAPTGVTLATLETTPVSSAPIPIMGLVIGLALGGLLWGWNLSHPTKK
jgi:Tol biopolymer transport system component